MANNAEDSDVKKASLSLSSSSCSSLSSKDPTAHSSWPAPDQNRTVRIVYYLSRGGLLEQPHLLEVPLSSPQSGLTLRDVKKKLMSIRGKAMPAAFAWSYKRSYRNGYVWQDLCGDGDLIFPPAANQSEYIIKGCKLSHNTCISKSEETEENDNDNDDDDDDGELVDQDQELGQDHHHHHRSLYSYGKFNSNGLKDKYHSKNSVDEDYADDDHRLSSASKSNNIISPLNLPRRNRRLSGANPSEVVMVKSSDAATQTEEELAAIMSNNSSSSNNSKMILGMNNMTGNDSTNQCINDAANGIINPRINPSIRATGFNHSNNHHRDHNYDPTRHVTMPLPSPSSSSPHGPTVKRYENRTDVIPNEIDVISRKLGQINNAMPSSSSPNTALNCSNPGGGASSSSNHRKADQGTSSSSSNHRKIDQGTSSSSSNHRKIDQGTSSSSSNHQINRTYLPSSSNYLSRYVRSAHDADEMIYNGNGGVVLMNHLRSATPHNYNYNYNSPKSVINLANGQHNHAKTVGNCYLQESQDEKKFVSSGDGEYLVTLSPNSLDQKCNKLCNNSLGNLLHNWVSSCGGIINSLEDQVKNQQPIRYDTSIIKHFVNDSYDCNEPCVINDMPCNNNSNAASKRFSFKGIKGLHNMISVLIKKDHYYNHNGVGDSKATNDGRFDVCNRNHVVINGDENCGTSSRRFSIGELIRAADDSPLRSSSGSLTDQYFFMRSCHDDDHRNNKDLMNNIKRKS